MSRHEDTQPTPQGVPALAPNRGEATFEDFKPPYSDREAAAEAHRCLYCFDAPCIKACPTAINIPEFIRKIATGNVEGSARTIFDQNILGMSCARVCPVEVLCVGSCVFNRMDEKPIQIGKLQRYATDRAFATGRRFYEAGPDSGKSVALVGAGPASLACAHRLRRAGHAVTIYEKRDVIGGLNTTGVAPYKMKADRALEEVEWVLGIGGVTIRTGVEIGRDVTFSDLEARHDAVFLGMGLGPDNRLGVPHEDLPGVVGAVDFIEQMKLQPASLAGVRRALVVGGGNTALDAVRELLGLGIPEVTMVYRGTERVMSGYAHEWEAARVEGATARWRAQPVACVAGADGRLAGLRVISLDENRKPIAGSEHDIPADLILVAIGQSKLVDALSQLDGLRFEKGRLVVGPDGATGRRGWYAGGDLISGGTEVVNAAAEGRDAAVAIDRFLSTPAGATA
jgi:dihydropyrimidine dehydrogenase (NAD+) subunit PreT